jgi:AraC-like DNA-binding protein
MEETADNLNNPQLRLTPAEFEFPLSGIFISTSHHAEGFTMAMHRSDYHELVVVRSGRGEVIMGETQLGVSAGSMLHIPPGKAHRFVDVPASPMTLHIVSFETEAFVGNPLVTQLYRSFLDTYKTTEVIYLLNTFRRNKIYHYLQEMQQEQTLNKGGCELMVYAICLQLLTFLDRMKGDGDEVIFSNVQQQAVEACLEYIEHHFIETITVDQLATLSGYSARRLTSLFKTQTGKTILQYLNEVRVHYSARRILETGNVTHSALESGFNDLTNFYRHFKKIMKKTPRAYLGDCALGRR